MRHFVIPASALLLVGACAPQPAADNQTATGRGNATEQMPGSNEASPVDAAGDVLPSEGPPVSGAVGTPGTPGGLPDDRTPLEEPSGPIDPKSAEGAGQLVQRYGGLLEQRKFAEARRLWGDGGKTSGLTEAQFVSAYDKYATIHSEVGKPTDMEGAAGSSYITVPFRLYGTLKSGGPFNLVGPLTLRRVNDVPGSTAAQRRWHIEKSGLKPRP